MFFFNVLYTIQNTLTYGQNAWQLAISDIKASLSTQMLSEIVLFILSLKIPPFATDSEMAAFDPVTS